MGECVKEGDVPPHEIVEVGFAWGGRVGKVVSRFAVELLRPRGTEYEVRVTSFRGCWYQTAEEPNQTTTRSPLLKSIAELPAPLAAEVRSLIDTSIVVAADVARHGLVQYIECPATQPQPPDVSG